MYMLDISKCNIACCCQIRSPFLTSPTPPSIATRFARRRNVLRKFDYVGEVKIHFDPSPRQEYLPGGPELRDTPDVFERKINAILKGRRDILGFTDVEVLYDRR